MFYKFNTNVDAYPFIFDPKLTDSDEKFIENLDALSSTCAGIELYNITEDKVKSLIPKIKEANFKMAILTSIERSYIKELVKKKSLELVFPDGYITASILRAAIDCRVHGIIPKEIIDKIYNDIDK